MEEETLAEIKHSKIILSKIKNLILKKNASNMVFKKKYCPN